MKRFESVSQAIVETQKGITDIGLFLTVPRFHIFANKNYRHHCTVFIIRKNSPIKKIEIVEAR